MKNQIGLRQRILASSNKDEINNLLQEGKNYKQSSTTTSRRWTVAANRRLESLEKLHLASKQASKQVLKQTSRGTK